MTSGEVHNIGIIVACEQNSALRTIENVSAGVKSANGAVHVFNMPYLGYLNKINPMTAKYANSFMKLTAKNIEAIIKTNMLDGVVIVSDCDITITGALLGCLRVNCPVLVAYPGHCTYHLSLNTNAKLVKREFDEEQADVQHSTHPSHNASNLKTFISLIHNFGFVVETFETYSRDSGLLIQNAYNTGIKIVENTKNMTLPRKLITKDKFHNAVNICLDKNLADFAQIELAAELARANDIKLDHDYITMITKKSSEPKIIMVRGSACDDGGYVQMSDSLPTHFQGTAKVYSSLEEADRAIGNGSIKDGVIVLHNCVDINVSAIVHTIHELGLSDKIAIATDGVCDQTSVLVVQKCTPNTYENEAFSNIQTGDVLEINLAKSRFNTSILAKDIKTRAKRNTTQKFETYFN